MALTAPRRGARHLPCASLPFYSVVRVWSCWRCSSFAWAQARLTPPMFPRAAPPWPRPACRPGPGWTSPCCALPTRTPWRACDTVGMLTPEKAYEFYGHLSKLDVPLSVHCHNDFGLAVANSLAGLRAGASQAHVTVNGIGERAGNASLEETVVALYSLYGVKTDINIGMLYEISKMAARLTNVPLQPNKAIVGENAFAHVASHN